MNILLFAIFAANLSILCLLVGVCVVFLRKYRDFVSFITPESEGKPSPAAKLVDAAAGMAARAIVAQFKGVFLGKQSGDARAEQAVMADIAEDALAQKMPLAAGILESFPTLKKSLRRNPALLDFALSKLAGSASGVATGGDGNGSTPARPRFKL